MLVLGLGLDQLALALALSVLALLTSLNSSCCFSCWCNFFKNNLCLHRFKSDPAEIWQDWSSSIPINWRSHISGWRHAFKMSVMTLFHAEKCCHLVSAPAASSQRICNQFLIHSTSVLFVLNQTPNFTYLYIYNRLCFCQSLTSFKQLSVLFAYDAAVLFACVYVFVKFAVFYAFLSVRFWSQVVK